MLAHPPARDDIARAVARALDGDIARAVAAFIVACPRCARAMTRADTCARCGTCHVCLGGAPTFAVCAACERVPRFVSLAYD